MSSKRRPSLIEGLELEKEKKASKEEAAPTKIRNLPQVQHTSVYIPREAHRRLREIAVAEDCKPHDLIMEGVNLVLRKRGFSESATKKKV
jgi:hypothetical protein